MEWNGMEGKGRKEGIRGRNEIKWNGMNEMT
jgi:hypothetical protein